MVIHGAVAGKHRQGVANRLFCSLSRTVAQMRNFAGGKTRSELRFPDAGIRGRKKAALNVTTFEWRTVKIEKTVFFVRHGQSVANVSAVFQGPDLPLSETGHKQARCIAERIARLGCAALIASPFTRARQTAEVIAAETGLQQEYSDLFVERIKPSVINGKSYRDEEASAIWREWERSLYSPALRVADGENFADLISRADAALDFLKERGEASLAVVTHGFFLRTIVARTLLGDKLSAEVFKRFQWMASMENTGLTVLRHHGAFEQEPGWRLWIYNDHAHLG